MPIHSQGISLHDVVSFEEISNVVHHNCFTGSRKFLFNHWKSIDFGAFNDHMLRTILEKSILVVDSGEVTTLGKVDEQVKSTLIERLHEHRVVFSIALRLTQGLGGSLVLPLLRRDVKRCDPPGQVD